MINESYPEEKNDYYNQSKAFLWEFIPDGPNVILDVGCASGRLGQKLLELNKASHLVGVEMFEPAAKEAMKNYDAVHVADIETLQLDYDKYFDVVVCSDILEHLKEPFNTLARIHKWLKNEGLLVCCVPNIRYWRILKDLVLWGEWRYEKWGILDHTHLRFFTVRSLKQMLSDASFKVVSENLRYVDSPRKMALNRMTLGLFKEFFGFQILISARKA